MSPKMIGLKSPSVVEFSKKLGLELELEATALGE